MAIPSHDTIQRVMAIVHPELLQRFKELWNEISDVFTQSPPSESSHVMADITVVTFDICGVFLADYMTVFW